MFVEKPAHQHRHPYPHLQERLYLVLAAIFISSLVSCNLIFQKFFHFTLFGFTFELSVGLLPYPVTFLVTDILSEIYGRKRANQVVTSGLIASVFMLLVVLVAAAVPDTDWSPVSDELFLQVFGLSAAAVFSSMVAYLLAQYIDIRIFHFWKRLTKGKHLWLRNNGSTIVSQLVDTVAVITLLCGFGTIPWDKWGSLVGMGFLFKVLVAAADTPLFYLATWYLRDLFRLAPDEELALPEEGF